MTSRHHRLKLSVVVTFFLYTTAIFLLIFRVWVLPYGEIRRGNMTNESPSVLSTITQQTPKEPAKGREREEVITHSGPKILTLFTTWNVSMESSFVYNNTVNILSSFLPEINLVVFLPEGDAELFEAPTGWTVLPISKVDCGDTPVLKHMFFDVYEKFDTTFYGYLNADILLDRGLIETLHAVKNYMFIKGKKQVLISGKRIDLYLDKIKRKYISTQKDVEYLSQVGTIAYGYAEDFFITTKSYPWRHIPDLVIGRPKYDNYLVYISRQRSVPVIDASMTILALHQRTKKRIKIKDECNERILKKAKKYNFRFIQRGNLECATYETRYNRDGKIYIYRRGQFTTKC